MTNLNLVIRRVLNPSSCTACFGHSVHSGRGEATPPAVIWSPDFLSVCSVALRYYVDVVIRGSGLSDQV